MEGTSRTIEGGAVHAPPKSPTPTVVDQNTAEHTSLTTPEVNLCEAKRRHSSPWTPPWAPKKRISTLSRISMAAKQLQPLLEEQQQMDKSF